MTLLPEWHFVHGSNNLIRISCIPVPLKSLSLSLERELLPRHFSQWRHASSRNGLWKFKDSGSVKPAGIQLTQDAFLPG